MINCLYVDSNNQSRKTVKKALEENSDIHVNTCSSPCEAMEMIRIFKCDIIISTYLMPIFSGIDFIKMVQLEFGEIKDLKEVAGDTLANLQLLSGDLTRITISGGGDPSCYPEFTDLIEILASLEAPIHIGYTSGKGFDDPDIAEFLIKSGLSEISFTVFAADPEIRRQYMHDPTPGVSLEILKRLAGAIEVYAALVIIPGINDGEILKDTIRWLEDAGVKGVISCKYS